MKYRYAIEIPTEVENDVLADIAEFIDYPCVTFQFFLAETMARRSRITAVCTEETALMLVLKYDATCSKI